jgi:hypothetical protein
MGDAFIFDTNALHRATIDGLRSRSVIMLEMNAGEKSDKLRRWANAPCPSSAEFIRPLPDRCNTRLRGSGARRRGVNSSADERYARPCRVLLAAPPPVWGDH